MRRRRFILSLSGALACGARAGQPAGPPPGMARIPGGTFTPAFAKSAQVRSVPGFHLDRLAVTNGDYLRFVTDHPEWQRSAAKRLFCDTGYLSHWRGDLDPGPRAPLDAPVINVSWFAARAFLRPLGKRLPSTDEWEFAARASATQADGSREPDFLSRILAWYAKPAPDPLPSVESAESNVFGVRGLHGLIWEWVNDFNNAITTGEGRSGDAIDRNLFCGGGAVAMADPGNYAAFMRFAFRSSLKGNYTVGNLGFRGARSLPSP